MIHSKEVVIELLGVDGDVLYTFWPESDPESLIDACNLLNENKVFGGYYYPSLDDNEYIRFHTAEYLKLLFHNAEYLKLLLGTK